jgi:hypothetical protein
MRAPSITLALCTLLLATACNDDLPKATSITHMRVLGTRIEVKGEPTRSTPKPGETAVMTFPVAFPSLEDDLADVSSLFITCTTPDRFTGIPICQEFIDLAQNPDDALADMLAGASMDDFSCKGVGNTSVMLDTIGLTCVTGTPKLEAKIAAKDKSAAKLVRGIVCQHGVPFLDPTDPALFGCKRKAGVKAADAESIPLYGTIPVQQKAADENDNPSFADSAMTFHGTDWNAPDPAGEPVADEDCATAAQMKMVVVSAGLEETLKISFDPKAREKADGEPELLELSAYATAGVLSRRFIVFEPDQKLVSSKLRDELTWQMTREERKKIGEEGKLVRFFFTMLDRRGGFDVTERYVCVIP